MNAKIQYAEKLLDPRWKARRRQILQRDNYLCVQCYPEGEKPEDEYNSGTGDDNELHVHHKYYESGKDPWDYPDDCLITLCAGHHEIEHVRIRRQKIEELAVFYGLPRLKGDGPFSGQECTDNFLRCIQHPNWLAYCTAKARWELEE